MFRLQPTANVFIEQWGKEETQQKLLLDVVLHLRKNQVNLFNRRAIYESISEYVSEYIEDYSSLEENITERDNINKVMNDMAQMIAFNALFDEDNIVIVTLGIDERLISLIEEMEKNVKDLHDPQEIKNYIKTHFRYDERSKEAKKAIDKYIPKLVWQMQIWVNHKQNFLSIFTCADEHNYKDLMNAMIQLFSDINKCGLLSEESQQNELSADDIVDIYCLSLSLLLKRKLITNSQLQNVLFFIDQYNRKDNKDKIIDVLQLMTKDTKIGYAFVQVEAGIKYILANNNQPKDEIDEVEVPEKTLTDEDKLSIIQWCSEYLHQLPAVNFFNAWKMIREYVELDGSSNFEKVESIERAKKLYPSKVEETFSFYVMGHFGVRSPASEWDMQILDELYEGVELSNLSKLNKATLLQYLDQLEDQKYSIPSSGFFTKKPQWQTVVNPAAFSESKVLKDTTKNVSESASGLLNDTGCDLYLMPELPNDFTLFTNSYILVGNNLTYIKLDAIPERVNISNNEMFLDKLKAINISKAKKIHLSDIQVKDLITSNGGHKHDTYNDDTRKVNADGVNASIMTDALRQNITITDTSQITKKRISGKTRDCVNIQIVVDLWIGNQQVKFNVTDVDVGHKQQTALESTFNPYLAQLKETWRELVRNEVTKDPILADIVNGSTHQNGLTQLPFSIIKELWSQQLLPANSGSGLKDAVLKLRIRPLSGDPASENEAVVYELSYSGRDEKGKELYSLKADVIVKPTGIEKVIDNQGEESPQQQYAITLRNIEMKGYDAKVKFMFPTIYNRYYLERQLASIKIPNRAVPSPGDRRISELAIKHAMRIAAMKVVDTIPGGDFEKFILELREELISKVVQDGNPRQRFEEIAIEKAKAQLKKTVNSIITTIYMPDRAGNLALLKGYLKDIENRMLKRILQKVAMDNKYLDNYPINKFNNFLVNAIQDFEKHSSSEKKLEKRFRDIADKQSPSGMVKDLYDLFDADKKEKLNSKIDAYLDTLSLQRNFKARELDESIVPKLLLEVVIDEKLGALGVDDSTYVIRDTIIDVLVPDILNMPEPFGEAYCFVYSYFYAKGKFKENIDGLVNDIISALTSGKIDRAKLKEGIEDITLRRAVQQRLESDLAGFPVDKTKILPKEAAYAEGLKFTESKREELVDSIVAKLKEKDAQFKLYKSITNDIRKIAKNIFDEKQEDYLKAVIAERLHLNDEDDSEKVSFYAAIIAVNLSLELMPIQTSWMANRKYIEAFADIITAKIESKRLDSDSISVIVDAWTYNDTLAIREEARTLVIKDLLTSDLRKYTEKMDYPDRSSAEFDDIATPIYQDVVLHTLSEVKPEETQVLEIEKLSREISLKAKDENLVWGQIRDKVLSARLSSEPGRHSKHYFARILKEHKKAFEKASFPVTEDVQPKTMIPLTNGSRFFWQKQTNTFVPNATQKALLARIAALHQLHYERCKQLFGEASETTKKALKQANKSKNSQQLTGYFKSLKMPGKSPDEVFNQYLLKQENLARVALDLEIQRLNQPSPSRTPEEKEKMMSANSIVAVINKYRYANQQSEFYNSSYEDLAGVIVNRNWFFDDFKPEWFAGIKEQLKGLLAGSPNPEKQLAALEVLESNGRDQVKSKGLLTRYFMNKKLDILHQFIKKFEGYYAENEGQRIVVQVKKDQDAVGAVKRIRKTQKKDLFKVKDDTAVYGALNQGHPNLFAKPIGNLSAEKQAQKLGEDIVRARISRSKSRS
jgi:hypothetical protein